MWNIGSAVYYPQAHVWPRVQAQDKLNWDQLTGQKLLWEPSQSLNCKKCVIPLPVTLSFSVPMLISSSSAENRTLSPSVLLTSNLWHWASTISEPERERERDKETWFKSYSRTFTAHKTYHLATGFIQSSLQYHECLKVWLEGPEGIWTLNPTISKFVFLQHRCIISTDTGQLV